VGGNQRKSLVRKNIHDSKKYDVQGEPEISGEKRTLRKKLVKGQLKRKGWDFTLIHKHPITTSKRASLVWKLD